MFKWLKNMFRPKGTLGIEKYVLKRQADCDFRKDTRNKWLWIDAKNKQYTICKGKEEDVTVYRFDVCPTTAKMHYKIAGNTKKVVGIENRLSTLNVGQQLAELQCSLREGVC